MIITSLLRFVNAYCALPRKILLDKSRFRKEMDMLGQITARDNLILVLQKLLLQLSCLSCNLMILSTNWGVPL